MTRRSAGEVAKYWTGAGGAANRQVEWVAISMGESGLDDAAVSPDGAIGLWQIMPFNAHYGGGSVGDLYDPAYNAKVAVIMSSNGANCAAWDSCYADIGRSGRYSYLSYPEKGSADYANIAIAGVAIGVDATSSALPEPALDIGAAFASAVSVLSQTIGPAMTQLHVDTASEHTTISKMYQIGWKAWMYSGR